MSQPNINLLDGDTVVADNGKLSDILNNHFVNIASSLAEPESASLQKAFNDILCQYESHPSVVKIKELNPNITDEFEFMVVTSDQLYNELIHLQSDQACGYDGYPSKLLKLGASVLCNSLLPIINYCLDTSYFSQLLKYAEITPIFKKGDNLSKNNYRPVSVLPCQSKLFEGLISKQLLNYFENKMSKFLAAYRKNYSTQHVLLRALDEWQEALDTSEHVGCLLMDLSKAFDALPHELLLAKLRAYGVSIRACDLLKSYLSNRLQRVKIGNMKSDWLQIKRGSRICYRTSSLQRISKRFVLFLRGGV